MSDTEDRRVRSDGLRGRAAYWRACIARARTLDAYIRQGWTVIAVPAEIGAHIRRDVWQVQVDTAARKWASVASEITLPEWRSAMTSLREERLAKLDEDWPPNPGSRD